VSAVRAATPHEELHFEDLIEKHLVAHGWERGTAYSFDRELGIDFDELFAFIGATQQEAWDELVERRGSVETAQREFRKLVAKRIDESGTLHVLRRGITDLGVDFRLAYFKPEHGMTLELVASHAANRCTVVRQLAYSENDPEKTLDLVLLLNGIPTATAELKNPLTGQNAEHAKHQYRHDRDPSEPIFDRRALVHFAVDPSLVFVTTRLQGADTVFLPFNQGSEGPGEAGGAGNPPAKSGRHATAYLWQEVWERDAWLELLHRFIHIEPSAPARRTRRGKGPTASGSVIFPRFQQWNAVRTLVAAARSHGAGRHYLVQHSAGSGKSNTIAWLAHRLAGLHAEDRKVFDKVVVITDRVVLDRQLQATIFQFDHEPGVVEKVEGTSAQLAEALESSTAKIVVSTLQKFPFVLERIGDLSEKRFAVIVDEAHSSQSGEAAKALRAALGSGWAPENEERDAEPDEVEEMTTALIERSARERGPQPNLSYFAFTATPTKRTLHVFGTRDGGELRPFHTYSMRQAIEEGFILDIMRRFMPYRVFWKVASTLEEDPEIERRKAAAEIVRFVSNQPETLEEKARIIVEHFRSATRKLVGGRAKAMVVTASRELAVRTHFALEAYIRAQGYMDCEPLVAFSGTVELDGEPWTEARINGFGERQLAARFAEDRYRILTVAEKYQTGFDQPLLHTMYVDKQLSGLRAVQTLSRLNRTHPGKDDTFVLDFVNSAEDIRAAFKPWYEETRALPTDPNELYSAREGLLAFGIFGEQEEAAFAVALLGGGGDDAHALLYAQLEPAKKRFEAVDEQARREFHAAAAKFCELYSFLAQGMGFADARLERAYLYVRHLQRVLPRERSQTLDLGDSLELTHLRIQAGAETDAVVDEGGEPMSPEGAQVGVVEAAVDPLSAIIRDLNERHGLQLGAGDEIFRRMAESLVEDEDLQEAAAANSFANFELLFDEKFEEKALEARNQSWEFFERAFGSSEVRDQLEDALAREVYARLTGERTWRDRLAGTFLTDPERTAVKRFVKRVQESLGDDLQAIWLYGSKARGDASEASDVDLLVLARGGRQLHRQLVVGIARELETQQGDGHAVLSATVQDRDWLAERRALEDFFVRDLDREKIVLFGGP
jgi:type I restriction enzyme R subunit